MSKIEQLHNQAMDLAEEAMFAKRKGDEKEAVRLFSKALEFEKEAASFFLPNQESEPTRSILYRSAASIAYHAGDYEAADRLIAHGLSGYPPAEIRNELKNLYDDINSMRQKLASDSDLLITPGKIHNHLRGLSNIYIREISDEEIAPVSYTGILKHANSPLQRKFGTVMLIDTEGNKRKIKVPISLMKEVVQPYYEEYVTIHGYKMKDKIYLDEISKKK